MALKVGELLIPKTVPKGDSRQRVGWAGAIFPGVRIISRATDDDGYVEYMTQIGHSGYPSGWARELEERLLREWEVPYQTYQKV